MQSNPTFNEQERIARQLEAVEGRYEELSIRITLPEVISDTALFTKLMREHSELGELNDIAVRYRKLLEDIEAGRSGRRSKRTMMGVGAEVIPSFAKDTTDRNRTSPFAFTGNKFEFRMPGSSLSVANANIVLNTAVAEALRQMSEAIEGAKEEDF